MFFVGRGFFVRFVDCSVFSLVFDKILVIILCFFIFVFVIVIDINGF